MCRSSEFKQKEVINITDGRRMGFVHDVEVDLEEGRIISIIIPGASKLFGLIGRNNEIIIPWENIKRIGEDIIFVDLGERFIRKYFDKSSSY
jgi:YlmC/YmxH family sporulation protein